MVVFEAKKCKTFVTEFFLAKNKLAGGLGAPCMFTCVRCFLPSTTTGVGPAATVQSLITRCDVTSPTVYLHDEQNKPAATSTRFKQLEGNRQNKIQQIQYIKP